MPKKPTSGEEPDNPADTSAGEKREQPGLQMSEKVVETLAMAGKNVLIAAILVTGGIVFVALGYDPLQLIEGLVSRLK